MKYLNCFESYKITNIDKRGDTDLFYFSTPENNYMVKITPYQGRDNFYGVGFGVIKDKQLGYDTGIVVNEKPFELMDTIFIILKDFIYKLRNNEYVKKYNLDVIDGFIFSFTGDKEKNKQRLKLYKRTLNKHLPDANLELKNGIYYIIL